MKAKVNALSHVHVFNDPNKGQSTDIWLLEKIVRVNVWAYLEIMSGMCNLIHDI